MSNEPLIKHPQEIVRSPFRFMQHLLGKLLPQKSISERSSLYLILQTMGREDMGGNEPVISMLSLYLKQYITMLPHAKNPRVFSELEKMETQLIELKSAIQQETGRRPQPLIRSVMERILGSIKDLNFTWPKLSRPSVDILEKKKDYLLFLMHQLEFDRFFTERYVEDIEKTKRKNAAIVLKVKEEVKSANKHWLKWNGPERRSFIQLAAEIEQEHGLLQGYLRSNQDFYIQLKSEVLDALAHVDSHANPVRFAERTIVSITHRYDLMYFNEFEAKIKEPLDWMLRAAELKAASAPKGKEGKKLPLLQGQECTNCASTEPVKPCSRCRSVWYCGKACQSQHWKRGGHKRFCVAVADRVPTKTNPPSSDEEKCVVCLDPLKLGETLSLGCGHTLHAECMADMISFGVAHACPTCRHAF